MADVTIASGTSGGTTRAMRSVVFTSTLIGYAFYIAGSGDLVYRKTTDGGATWGSEVIVYDAGVGLARTLDVWFDKWTPGGTGTLIHIWYTENDTASARYRSLDTNGDTLGTEAQIFDGTSSASNVGLFISGTKARGGNLYCAFSLVTAGEMRTFRSTDGGATWGVRTNLVEIVGDWAQLFPGNEGDTQDICALYLDVSADELTLKVHDDSADTNSESAAIATVVENTTDFTAQYPFAGSVRASDGHLIAAVVTELDTATADFRVFDINGTGSIVEKTAIATNIDDIYYPSVFIDPINSSLHVAYIGKRDGSETLATTAAVYYTKSTDGGTSWSAGDTAYSAAGSDYRQTWAPLTGQRFLVLYRDLSSGNIFTNTDNSRVFPQVSLAGSQAAPSGRVRQSAGTLKGNQAAPSGSLAVKRSLSNVTLAGAPAAPSGSLAVKRSLSNVTLAGAQATPSGALSASAGRFESLAGEQPASSGTVPVFFPFRNVFPAGAQAAPSGLLGAQLVFIHVSLAGNQRAPSSTLVAVFRERTMVFLPGGRALLGTPGLRAGRARAQRPGAL